jgi:hypothetical protein
MVLPSVQELFAPKTKVVSLPIRGIRILLREDLPYRWLRGIASSYVERLLEKGGYDTGHRTSQLMTRCPSCGDIVPHKKCKNQNLNDYPKLFHGTSLIGFSVLFTWRIRLITFMRVIGTPTTY